MRSGRLLLSIITEIRTIQLRNPEGERYFGSVAMPDNCVPFDRTVRERYARVTAAPTPAATDALTDIFDHLSPAQYAFLNGVLAILAEQGEEALTRSCEMVIERFGRGTNAG